ncbi:hypothetical protein DMA11_20675 [Marinilabiliaceae bacterium JC017]|nr:hypothetical protein DMA11_20675 [Marinilabiliaceae bacterium JC017]
MNGNIKIKVSAGLLPLTVAISLILTVICGALILVLYYNNLLWLKHEKDMRFVNNILSAREYVLASNVMNFPPGEVMGVDLFDEGKDSVLIQRNRWGAFDLFLLEAIGGKRKRKEAFLAAKTVPLYPEVALYLADHNGVGLTLIGHTSIVGNASLPKQGVQAGYLNHQSFVGAQLVNGTREQSLSTIPQLSEEFTEVFRNLTAVRKTEKTTCYKDLRTISLDNPFTAPTKYLVSDERITLSEAFSGNIIICSSAEIEITSSCQTDNVILVAPRVLVKSRFSGNLQVFATESIVVEDHVKMGYPSVLVCQNSDGTKIEIGRNTVIEGGVYHLDFQKGSNESYGSLFIDEALVVGQVVSSGNVELLGSVYGQLICEKTIYRGQGGKIYNNYLVDCEIDITKLPALFLFPAVLDNQSSTVEILRDL